MNKIAIGTLPERTERTLYSKADEIRKIEGKEERMRQGAELLSIIYRISDGLAAVSWELKGILELKAKMEL